MKIVNTGRVFRVYSDDLKVRDKLAADVYIVRFHPMQGFFLELFSGMEVSEEKIYGVHMGKVKKVVGSFKKFTRNLGVILSGDKGIGKSLFARILSNSLVSEGYPVIVVDEFFPGINTFLESIEQEAVVLFDEFDKTFSRGRNDDDGGNSPQASLLSMLDGVSCGKKLYVITCNNVFALNDFFINRPGRFHYHFRFGYPDAQGVREYLQDKLPQDKWDQIGRVVQFAAVIPLNYDCLRAIAYELQEGEVFEEAIQDLNILNVNRNEYEVTFHLADGQVFTRLATIDMFSNKDKIERLSFINPSERMDIIVEFDLRKLKYDEIKKHYAISGNNLKSWFTSKELKEREKEDPSLAKARSLKYITVKKAPPGSLHYEF